MEFPKYDNPPPPPPTENKVFNGEFNVEKGVLNFVCHTKNVSFEEAEKGLIKLRDEINRQLELKMNCPFVQPDKAVPSTGKQKYYFAVYQQYDWGNKKIILSESNTDLQALKDSLNDCCTCWNTQYFEIEYEVMPDSQPPFVAATTESKRN